MLRFVIASCLQLESAWATNTKDSRQRVREAGRIESDGFKRKIALVHEMTRRKRGSRNIIVYTSLRLPIGYQEG